MRDFVQEKGVWGCLTVFGVAPKSGLPLIRNQQVWSSSLHAGFI
jgi:hypothetical protein